MILKFRGLVMLLAVLILLGGVACNDEGEEDEAGVEIENTVVSYPEGVEPVEEGTVPTEAESARTFDLAIADGEFVTEEEFVVPAGDEITLNVTNEDAEGYAMLIGEDAEVRQIPPDNISHIVIEAPEAVGVEFEARLLAADDDPIEENVLDTVLFLTEEFEDVEEDEDEG